MLLTKSVLLASATITLSMPLLSAQDEAIVKIRSEVRVVEVDITVRDAGGAAVRGLEAKDFTILDNGKPRPFTIFHESGVSSDSTAPVSDPTPSPSPAAPTPNTFSNGRITAPPTNGHSTILLMDGVNGWFDSFAHARKGVEDLLAKVPPDEKIAVYVIVNDFGLAILQDYTTDRHLLLTRISSFTPQGMKPAPPGIGDFGDGGGLIEKPSQAQRSIAAQVTPQEREFQIRKATEALRLSLNALAARLRDVPGRKSVFWITEGFPPSQMRGMDAAWNSTLGALNDANIQINTVDADGLGGPSRYWGSGGILSQQEIATRTGGTAYFHRNDLDAAMASGIAESRSGYTLGFYVSDMDGKYHDLKVHVDRPGLQLTHRLGYYAQREAVAEITTRKMELATVLLNPVDLAGVGISVTLDLTRTASGKVLNARLKLDADSLSIAKSAGGWTGLVEEMFVQLDEAEHELGRQSDRKKFEVTAAGKPAFDANGITLSQTLPVVANAARLRIIVRDSASGRTGSLTVPLNELTPR